MKKRNWTTDEKLAIVLEGLKEKRSVAKICGEHQISDIVNSFMQILLRALFSMFFMVSN